MHFRTALFVAAAVMSSSALRAMPASADDVRGSVTGIYEGNTHAEGIAAQIFDGSKRHYVHLDGGVTPPVLRGKTGYRIRMDFRVEELGGPEGSEAEGSIRIMEKTVLISGKDDPELCRIREQAEAEDPKACNTLGVWYEKGRHGLPKDPVEAVHWYSMAAMGGSALAMHNMGDCFRDGIGVDKDEDEAVSWYEKAIKAGNPIGYEDLGNLYLRRGRKESARAMYEKAAEAGRASAVKKLAELK